MQGEWVYVEVEVDNPMHVPLQLSALKLACTPYHADGTKGIAKTLQPEP